MKEELVLCGLGLILVGIFLIFLGVILGSKENVKTEWGFFGLIGPIPFGFWNSKRAFLLSIIMVFISLLIILILIKKW